MRSILLVASAFISIPYAIAASDAAPQNVGQANHSGHAAPSAAGATPAVDANWIAAAVAAPTRTPANRHRDQYRNPAETLAFFGIKAGDTIVELYPGAGWYTEILAPLSKTGGNTLVAASEWKRLAPVLAWAKDRPDVYGHLTFAEFPATGAHPSVADGSADVVMAIRNVHNWRMDGSDVAVDNFKKLYAMLKPGGVLGVVEHRLDETDDTAKEEKSGYMKESTVIALAQAAGFQLAARSEINANPKDTKDYANGVWTLPPVLRDKDVNREQYLAIGESDRMTLKFVKPAA